MTVAIAREHELHHRRLGRNVGTALCLLAFVAVVFALSVVKIHSGEPTEAFDHVVRPALEPAVQDPARLAPPAPVEEGR